MSTVERTLNSLSPLKKLEAIHRLQEGESEEAVAKSMGIPESTLRDWYKNKPQIKERGKSSKPSLIGVKNLGPKFKQLLDLSARSSIITQEAISADIYIKKYLNSYFKLKLGSLYRKNASTDADNVDSTSVESSSTIKQDNTKHTENISDKIKSESNGSQKRLVSEKIQVVNHDLKSKNVSKKSK